MDSFLHNTSERNSISLNTAHQYKVMLSFAFNVRMSEKLCMDMDIYMHVLLEYIPDCSIRVYRSFKQVLKMAHVTSVNPSLIDECKLYQLLCCAITLYYSLTLPFHTK